MLEKPWPLLWENGHVVQRLQSVVQWAVTEVLPLRIPLCTWLRRAGDVPVLNHEKIDINNDDNHNVNVLRPANDLRVMPWTPTAQVQSMAEARTLTGCVMSRLLLYARSFES